MTVAEVLGSATLHIESLKGRVLDVLALTKPASLDSAVNLIKIISKLSPLLGNVIEFSAVEFLNGQPEYAGVGLWKRQDPDFPDAIFESAIKPAPGLEIKAWFPFATEITARFKISQALFTQDHISVCLLAWTLDDLVFGQPRIIDVCLAPARSVANARDKHYHRPPDYLVLEPEDTSLRTRNLRQTNVNGYKWQDTAEKLKEAELLVKGWGEKGKVYSPSIAYQARLRDLLGRFRYRLDTNFAKMDRIVHVEIEGFKERVLNTQFHGVKLIEWARLFRDESGLRAALEKEFEIGRGR